MEVNHNMANQGDVNKTQTSNKGTAPSVLSQRKTGSVDDWSIPYDNRRFSGSKARSAYKKALRTYQYDPSQWLIIPWPIKFEIKTFDPRSQNTLSTNIVSSASTSTDPTKSISFPCKLNNIIDPSGEDAGIVVHSQNGLLCDNIIEFYKPKVPKFFKHLRLVSKFQPAAVSDGIVHGKLSESTTGENFDDQSRGGGLDEDGDDDEPVFVQRNEYVDLRNEYQIIVEQEPKPTDEIYGQRQKELGKLDWKKDLNDDSINSSPENRERFAKFVYYKGWERWTHLRNYRHIMGSPNHNQLKIALCRRGETNKLMYYRDYDARRDKAWTYMSVQNMCVGDLSWTYMGDLRRPRHTPAQYLGLICDLRYATDDVDEDRFHSYEISSRTSKGMEWHCREVEKYAIEILLSERTAADYGSREVKRLITESWFYMPELQFRCIEMLKGSEHMLDSATLRNCMRRLEEEMEETRFQWHNQNLHRGFEQETPFKWHDDGRAIDSASEEVEMHKMIVKHYRTLGPSVMKQEITMFNAWLDGCINTFRNLYFESVYSKNFYFKSVHSPLRSFADAYPDRSLPPAKQRIAYIPKLKAILSAWQDLYEDFPTPFEVCSRISFDTYLDLFESPTRLEKNMRADINIVHFFSENPSSSMRQSQNPFLDKELKRFPNGKVRPQNWPSVDKNSIFYQNLEKVSKYRRDHSHPKCKFAAKMSQQFFWDVEFVC